jgi:hypothetical protein
LSSSAAGSLAVVLARSLVYGHGLSAMAAGFLDYNLRDRRRWERDGTAAWAAVSMTRAMHIQFDMCNNLVKDMAIFDATEAFEGAPMAFLMVPDDFDVKVDDVKSVPHFPVVLGSAVRLTRLWECPHAIYVGQSGEVNSIDVVAGHELERVDIDGVEYGVLRPKAWCKITLRLHGIADPVSVGGVNKSETETYKIWPFESSACLPIESYRNQTVERLVFDAAGLRTHDHGLELATIGLTRTKS